MSDFVITEEDGWFEISDLINGMESQKDLWEYIGQGKKVDAADLLDMEIGDELKERFGTKSISGVKALSVPDDMIGERLRVWIQVGSVTEWL